MTPPKKKHTLSALVENKFGVLARVAGMLSGRGFNIETLNVGPTHDPAYSRITATVVADDAALDAAIIATLVATQVLGWPPMVSGKLGAVQEGVLRRSFLRHGEYHDQVLWGILSDDWRLQRLSLHREQAQIIQPPFGRDAAHQMADLQRRRRRIEQGESCQHPSSWCTAPSVAAGCSSAFASRSKQPAMWC